MKSFRPYLAVVLILNLSASPLFAGPESDADAYVESTREGARDEARILFHQYLEDAAIQATGVLKYADSFNQLSQNLADQMSKLEQLRLQLAQAAAKADVPTNPGNVEQVASQLQDIYQSTSDIYVAVRAAEKKRDYIILKNGQQEAEIDNAFSAFLNNIQTTCQNGIAANFQYPNLPAIRPIVPSYSFGVNVTIDENGNTSVEPQVPSVETKGLNGDAATAVYTSAYAGGFVLGAYLITGKVILTAAAAQTMTAASALAASGVGLAVAAVVALVVYFDGLFGAIEQSHEVSNALWIVHNQKADAETVRAEFKNICKPFADRAAKIGDRVKAVRENDAQAIADLNSERALVKDGQDKLMKLQKALDDQLTSIKQSLDSDSNYAKMTPDQRSEEAMKRLAGTSAYTDMQDYIKNTQSDDLMNTFEVSLIDIGLHLNQVDEAMKSQYQELFKKQADQHLDKIINLAVLGRRMAIPDSVRTLVKAELQANDRIAGLFREFDADFAGYVNSELTLGQDDSFKNKLVQWMAKVTAAQKDLPTSPTLKLLVARGQSFLQFLGVKTT